MRRAHHDDRIGGMSAQIDFDGTRIDHQWDDRAAIGTNDLTQFLFAADRAHPKLAERYDWLSPAILRRASTASARSRGTPAPPSA